MKKSRKWPIILIVGGILLSLGSAVLSYSNLFKVYEIAGESFSDTNKQESLNELQARTNIATLTKVGFYAGLAVLVAGIVWYRKLENARYKEKTKDKIVY